MTAFTVLLAAAALAAPAADPAPPADPVTEPQRADDIVVTGQRSEGSEDYAVESQRTATRIALSTRETPQSVSVVTRAQIEDFQLNDVNALLTTVPGISVLAAETDRVYYSARGFDIQTFQIDGVGLPFSFGIQTGSIDTAIYDRVEVVRGAPGLLSPTGNPSALINSIRKRPYRELRASASAQYGSFDNLRLDGDVSVPLTSDGNIRARAVGAYLDTDSYLTRLWPAPLDRLWHRRGGSGRQHRRQRRLWPSGPQEPRSDVGCDPALLHRRFADRPGSLCQTMRPTGRAGA